MTATNTEALAIAEGTPARSTPPEAPLPGLLAYTEDEEKAVVEVIRSRNLYRFMGDEGDSPARQLELEMAEANGTKHALAVTSGTAALLCSLQGLGVGPGDEVIVPAFCWIASVSAILAIGAVPIITEVDDSLTLDPDAVRANISPYTKAIMPVHMRGVPANMTAIVEIAKEHGLLVLEDTAQANGGSFGGKALGSIGDVGAFSLQASKIITTGEGGMVITDDDEVYTRATMFHDPFASRLVEVPESRLMWGLNFRMNEMIAAAGRVQLAKRKRIVDAMRVRKGLIKNGIGEVTTEKGIGFRRLHDEEGDTAVSLVMFLPTQEDAGRVGTALAAENISAGRMFDPEGVDQHVYASWHSVLNKMQWSEAGGPWSWARRDVEYSPDMCPVSTDLLSRAVQLHVMPTMSNTDVEETIDGTIKVLSALL